MTVAPLLAERLFAGPPVVLCSATLADARGLAYFREEVGCPEGAADLRLASPFPYPELARLYLPPNPAALDPGRVDEAAYVERVASETRALVRAAGGAFLLCSSASLLAQLLDRLRPELDQRLLVHGERERAELVCQLRGRRRRRPLWAKAHDVG